VHAQRILARHFIPAANILFGQKVSQNADFQFDAVHKNAAGIGYWPVGAEDKPILAKGAVIECFA
jgi:hypothetical protein